MRIRILAVALTACIPAVSFAQRGGGGGGAAGASDPGGSSALTPIGGSSGGMKSPTSRDLADMNPAAMLVDKRKKAALPDSTVAQLKAVQKKIDERNAQFFTAYDSVRKWTMPIGNNSNTRGIGLRGGVNDSKISAPATSTGEQAQMQTSMRDLRLMMTEFTERHNTDVADALAFVPEAQKKAATELLQQQTSDLAKLLGGRP